MCIVNFSHNEDFSLLSKAFQDQFDDYMVGF